MSIALGKPPAALDPQSERSDRKALYQGSDPSQTVLPWLTQIDQLSPGATGPEVIGWRPVSSLMKPQGRAKFFKQFAAPTWQSERLGRKALNKGSDPYQTVPHF